MPELAQPERRARADRRRRRLRDRPARDRGSDGAGRRHAAARARPRERGLGRGGRRRASRPSAKGDAVLVYPPYSCGLCVACRRGNDMHCERHEFTGLSVDGGFADYVLVSERSLLRLPAGVEPAAVAPHADAGLTAYHAVRRLAHLAVPGTTAVVIGVGGVGHIALQLVRELGSSAVIAVDTDERRRRLAAELGADDVVEGRRRDCGARADRRPRRGPRLRLRRHRPDPRRLGRDARPRRHLLGHRLRRHDLDPVGGARRERARGRRQPRRHVDRPLGAAPAPRGRPGHAEDRDAPARRGERRAREAPRRRGHRPRGARPR